MENAQQTPPSPGHTPPPAYEEVITISYTTVPIISVTSCLSTLTQPSSIEEVSEAKLQDDKNDNDDLPSYLMALEIERASSCLETDPEDMSPESSVSIDMNEDRNDPLPLAAVELINEEINRLGRFLDGRPTPSPSLVAIPLEESVIWKQIWMMMIWICEE